MSKRSDRFAQVEKWVGAALLTLLIVVLFGSLAQGRQLQLAVAPTPSAAAPATEPYPGPLRSPAPPSTPGPYPLPTGAPLPTVPTPKETVPPTPVLTPTAFVSGVKILWAEAEITNAMQYGPCFVSANVGDMGHRVVVYSLRPNLQLVQAALSTDGSQVAFTTLPKSSLHPASEGTLWTMNVDGSSPRELASGIEPRNLTCSYPSWSPDDRFVVYTKYAPISVSPNQVKDEDSERRELHIAAADGSWDRALIADDVEKPALIGWTPDGRVLYSRPVGQGQELWTVGVAGDRTLITLMHTEPVIVYPQLSPDRRKMIYVTQDYSGVTQGLAYLSVNGRDKRSIDFIDPDTARRFIGWASNDEIILHTGLAQYRILDVQTGAYRDITVSPAPDTESDSFLSMSPDREWLAMENYPKAGADLLKINSQVRVRITDNWLLFLGWLKSGV